MIKFHNTLLAGTAFAALFASGANATDFNIQSGDLGSALNAYMAQSGVVLIVSGDAVKGIKTRGVKGDLAPDAALSRLLSGTGFLAQPNSGVIAIVREGRSSEATDVQLQPMQLAQAA
ncbi:MAG: STN domain-containing protein, partial [Proteobacteria bacterium]|nr:STN domain-containing protein [Pseudomonadota bacterium]